MVQLLVYLPAEDLPVIEKLKEIAKREGKSKGQLVRELIADYVKKHSEGNPAFAIDKWIEDPTMKAYPTLGTTITMETVMGWDTEMTKDIHDRAEALAYLTRKVLANRGESAADLRVTRERRPKGT